MPQEIELKLRVAPEFASRLAQNSALTACVARKQRLRNTYYDTAERALTERGVALRLRRRGGECLMTVKGGKAAAGGLAQRNEWEAVVGVEAAGVESFDFSIVTDASLRDFLQALRPRLLPLFTTDFTRTTWLLQRSGASIELALDRGRIAACLPDGQGSVAPLPLCEIEIELLEGDSPDALFDLAIELAADLPLHPEILSKAERGYALVDRSASLPCKSIAAPVLSDMTPLAAFREISLACLLQLQRNEAGMALGEDPEFVHQARVAIRRLRSALKVFAPLLPAGFAEIYAPRWRSLAGVLGDCRDREVFLTDTLVALETAFPCEAELKALRDDGETGQKRARQAVCAALAQREYGQLVLAFAASLFRIAPLQAPPVTGGKALSLRKFADGRLRRMAAIIACRGGTTGWVDAACRHQLRLDCKRLRCALDDFAPLLPRKRLRVYRLQLTALQDLLGQLNDLDSAARLIGEMRPQGLPDLVRGWLGGRHAVLLARFDSELKAFLASRQPWRQ